MHADRKSVMVGSVLERSAEDLAEKRKKRQILSLVISHGRRFVVELSRFRF